MRFHRHGAPENRLPFEVLSSTQNNNQTLSPNLRASHRRGPNDIRVSLRLRDKFGRRPLIEAESD